MFLHLNELRVEKAINTIILLIHTAICEGYSNNYDYYSPSKKAYKYELPVLYKDMCRTIGLVLQYTLDKYYCQYNDTLINGRQSLWDHQRTEQYPRVISKYCRRGKGVGGRMGGRRWPSCCALGLIKASDEPEFESVPWHFLERKNHLIILGSSVP